MERGGHTIGFENIRGEVLVFFSEIGTFFILMVSYGSF